MFDNRGLMETVIGDGRPLLMMTGLALALSGGFAIFLAATGHFLPHDVYFLGMDAADLCVYQDCRIVQFMIHDRVAFGGAVVAVGLLYLWLTEFPLRHREGWAWWAYLFSGVAGFASFFTFLGFNYLDTWHAAATLAMFPFFVGGMIRTWQTLRPAPLLSLVRASRWKPNRTTVAGIGRGLLLLTALGLLGAGLFIMVGGMTRVFVPQDLHYMHLEVGDLHAISHRLVPLIAHDRANFGGALFAAGVAIAFCAWFATPTRNLWQILLVAGTMGFGCAAGVHVVVGYNNFTHLLPAFLGIVVFYIGLALSYTPMVCDNLESSPPHPRRRAHSRAL